MRRFVADGVKFRMCDGLAHVCFASGSKEFRFTTSVAGFLEATRLANKAVADWGECQCEVVAFKKRV
jgi:hypothetical protein